MKKRNRFTRGKFRTRRPPGTMNKTEQAYSEVLNELQRTGAILEWRYEPLSFKLADNTRYTPDFVVQYPDGAMEVHEVKACKRTGGFLAEDDAMVKIKGAYMQSWKVTCYPGSRIVGLTVYKDGRPIDGIVWHGIDDWSDAETVSVAQGSFHDSSVMQRVVQHIAAGELDHGQALELTADLRDGWERCLESEPKPMTTADLIRDILRKFGA